MCRFVFFFDISRCQGDTHLNPRHDVQHERPSTHDSSKGVLFAVMRDYRHTSNRVIHPAWSGRHFTSALRYSPGQRHSLGGGKSASHHNHGCHFVCHKLPFAPHAPFHKEILGSAAHKVARRTTTVPMQAAAPPLSTVTVETASFRPLSCG